MQEKKLHDVELIFNAIKNHYKLRTYRELAAFLEVKEGTLNAWKARNSIGNVDAILAKCKGMNYEWLKTGQGEMFQSNVAHLPSEIPSNTELVCYFKNKELARLIILNLIKLEQINPKALKKINEYIKLEIRMEGEDPDKELVWQEIEHRLKNGTSDR